MIRVLIADTRRLFAEALGHALIDRPGLEVIRLFPSHGREVLNVVESQAPDVVLLDYQIGEMRGATVARLITKRAPRCKVVLLSWFLTPGEKEARLQSSVSAVLSKGVDLIQVEKLIRDVASREEKDEGSGSAFGAAEQAAEIEELERLIKLTPRELDVLTLLAFRPKDIAETLKISEKTVRNHVNSILGKTQARSAVEAVSMARRNGIL